MCQKQISNFDPKYVCARKRDNVELKATHTDT